jgi:cell wall-associated NlpC family hydrolase
MKKLLLLALLLVFITSCGSSRTVSKTKTRTFKTEKVSKTSNNAKAENIIDYAKTFEGTRYKFGGTTNKGMDCSGLVFTAFKKENIALPRISRDMAKRGKRISLPQITEGDLVFFRTNKNKKSINHVGLVVEFTGGEVFFIHSTTSRGVIISSLQEGYWKSTFVEVRRII